MESGLRDRNNALGKDYLLSGKQVSMKSGLRDRNNALAARLPPGAQVVLSQ